jgi:hypothetical protein
LGLASFERVGVVDHDGVVSAMRYTNQEKFQILQRARETLERLDEQLDTADVERSTWPTRRSILDPMSRSSEPLARWRREAEEAEAKRARYRERTTAELNAQRSRDWEAWAVAIVARELAAHDRTLTEVLGQVVAEIRHRLRAEFRHELAEAVKELRREIAVSKAHDDDSLVDLPSPLLRKQNDAA